MRRRSVPALASAVLPAPALAQQRWPNPIPRWDWLAGAARLVHLGAAILLAVALVAHLGVVLRHTVILGNGLIRRMMPARRQATPACHPRSSRLRPAARPTPPTAEDFPPVPGQDSIDELRRVVGEDARFQRRVWVAQRAGWVALGAFVLLAAVGGLGDGPLAAIEATSPDGALRIRHDAVARQDSAMHWHVVLPPGSRALTITSDALEGMEVHNIQPATARQSRGQDWLTLQFDPAGDETSRVMLTIEPITPGLAAFTVTSGHREASFRTVVLP